MPEKKKKYTVSLPITGYITCEVEAVDEEGSFKAAWEMYEEGIEGFEDPMWEAVEKVVDGNCFHGMLDEQESFTETEGE